MAQTKLNNGQLPTTISSKTIDSSNTINTDLTKLSISGGTNGQVLSTDGSSNLSWTTASGGGGISDGDKGDITVSSSGTVWTIDNDAVTFAKMQNVNQACILGRNTAGTGDIQQLSWASPLTVSGTTLQISNNSITSGLLQDSAVLENKIANNAVTYAKMQDVSATSRLLGRASAGSGDIEEITIGSGLSLTGTTLSASGGSGGPLATVTKTANETVTNSTTLQTDDHLFYNSFSSARSYYIVFELLIHKADDTSNPQMRFCFDFSYFGTFYDENSGIYKTADAGSYFVTPPLAGFGTFPHPLVFYAAVQSRNGQGILRWCQDTASANGITVRKGSKMTVYDLGTI